MSANDGAASSSNVTAEELIRTVDSVPSANDEAASSNSDQDAIMKKEAAAEDSVPRANDETASINNGDIITDPDQEAAVEVQQLPGLTRRDTTSAAWMSSSYERGEASDKQVGQHPHTQGQYMDPPSYVKAAIEDNIDPFKYIEREIDSIVTPNKNTILHINIMSRTRLSKKTASTKFVEYILDICPSLLFKANVNAETPLHVAAKYGDSDMVEFLITSSAKLQHEDPESGREAAMQELIRMTNNEGDTALHVAVKYTHLDVVKILTREDPYFIHASNNRGETPLYIAAAAKLYITADAAQNSLKIVLEILETCKSPAYEGPHQMTVLHAIAMIQRPVSGIIKKILEKKEGLIKKKDQYGWTPLHYAAYHGNYASMEVLLACDISTAYIGDNRKMTPLHIAIGRGYIPKYIISHCPDCCELVTERRWNVLHFAVLSLSIKDLKILLNSPLIRNLINDKNVDGNTPLHLLATVRSHLLSKIQEVGDIKLDLDVVNDQNMSVFNVYLSGSDQLKQEIQKLEESVGSYQYGVVRVNKASDEEKIRKYEKAKEYLKAKESHLIVAALIATVTFTAAFTLPGGAIQNGDNMGTAILSKNTVFRAFVITDAIAMVLSLSAVFAHFLMSLRTSSTEESTFLLNYGSLSTMIAMGAMVIAFVTGTFAVLTTSLWLAILTTFIGFSFFILIFLICKGMTRAEKKRDKSVPTSVQKSASALEKQSKHQSSEQAAVSQQAEH